MVWCLLMLSNSGAYVPTKEELRSYVERGHVLHSKQFDTGALDSLFSTTALMKAGQYSQTVLKGKIIAMLFYEPSTRTRFSFETAALRLGAQVIGTESAKVFSSAAKGESISDTIGMMNIYADAVVLRTTQDMDPFTAAHAATIPIINAGSGTTQHPTQSLLDLFTIYERFGSVEGLSIVIAGDLFRGRTVDSLVFLLTKYRGNRLHFVSPENSRIKDSLRDHLVENDIDFSEHDSFDGVLDQCDICYMTRIQRERFDSDDAYERARGKVRLDTASVSTMKDSAIILHPLPRLDEIEQDVDLLPQAYYFKQAENGMYVRMALLQALVKD